jgi:hypothetical protein
MDKSCVRRCFMGVLLLVAAGCGGGGKDGDPGSGTGLSVTPSSLTFTATRLAPPPPAQVISVTITSSEAAFIGAGYVGETEPSWLTLSFGSMANPVEIVAAVDTTSLAAGTYTATLRIGIARADESIIGYRDVTITCTVAPVAIAAAPAMLSFTQLTGSAAPAGQTLGLSAAGDSYPWTASVQYTDGDGWLTVGGAATANGTSLPSTLAVSVPGAPGLAPGTYAARVHLSGAGKSIDVPVSLTVRPATLTAPASIPTFQAVAGQPTPPAAVDVAVGSEAGTISFTTSVAYGATASGWLDVPASGTAPTTVSFTPNKTLLSAGTHEAIVTLTPSNGAAPVDVHVGYTLVASQLGTSPGSITFSVHPTTELSALTQALEVTDTGAQLSWTAQSSQPWLSVSPSSGNTGTTVSVVVDETALETLARGSHNATLTITSNGPSVTNVTKTVNVTLDVDLPVVRHVAPYVAYVGEAKEVIVRGEGFNALTISAVDFDGSPGTAAQVVSDTELRVTPPPTLATGSHLVRITTGNALGLDRSTAHLAVVTAPTHTAGLIASAGPRQRVVYDAERRCLYGANTAANAIQRFCDADGTWTSSSLAVSGVVDLALTPDGQQLVAISDGSLYRVSLMSFAVIGSPVTAAQLGITLSPYDTLGSIVVTNDGKALIAAGYSWMRLYRYDLDAGGSATAVGPLFYSTSSASIMGVSLDGDRVITGESGISAPNFVRYDATDGSVTEHGSISQYIQVYSVTVDRTGSRIGAGGGIYDGALATVGSAGNWRLAISADGGRAYSYVPGTPAVLRTYDITGGTASQVGGDATFSVDPGSTNNAHNLLLTSLDSGTLFIDGTSGILVMPAP